MSLITPSNIQTDQKTDGSNGYPGKPITEIIANGFFTVDRQWTVTHWNKAAENLLGLASKDMIGHNLWEKLIGIIPPEFHTVCQQVFARDDPDHAEEYWEQMGTWSDVTIFHLDDTLSISFKSSTQPAHKESPEQQLKILNELYRCVTEITNDCLWEWDIPGREIFWIDGTHKKVFGYPIVNAVIPQIFWENRVHPDDRERLLTRLNKIIASGSLMVWEDEYRFKKSNGEYAYVHDRAHIIYDKFNKACRMIGATQDITARKISGMQLLESERKLAHERFTRQKEITDAVLLAQERERADIGKELHDNLNQILGAAKLYIELAKTDEKSRDLYLEKSSGFLVNVIESIRTISKTLAVPGAHLMGLSESISILLDDMRVIHPLQIDFHRNGIDEEGLAEHLQLDIFRIVQEQLNNIVKHSEASRATISLTREAAQIILLITDNGVGCDLLKEKKGVGIINIKSRAELHHGSIAIASNPGEGFELKVVFPLYSSKNTSTNQLISLSKGNEK